MRGASAKGVGAVKSVMAVMGSTFLVKLLTPLIGGKVTKVGPRWENAVTAIARALHGVPHTQAHARFGLASRPRPSYTALSLQIVFAAQPLVTDPQGIWIGL